MSKSYRYGGSINSYFINTLSSYITEDQLSEALSSIGVPYIVEPDDEVLMYKVVELCQEIDNDPTILPIFRTEYEEFSDFEDGHLYDYSIAYSWLLSFIVSINGDIHHISLEVEMRDRFRKDAKRAAVKQPLIQICSDCGCRHQYGGC